MHNLSAQFSFVTIEQFSCSLRNFIYISSELFLAQVSVSYKSHKNFISSHKNIQDFLKILTRKIRESSAAYTWWELRISNNNPIKMYSMYLIYMNALYNTYIIVASEQELTRITIISVVSGMSFIITIMMLHSLNW